MREFNDGGRPVLRWIGERIEMMEGIHGTD